VLSALQNQSADWEREGKTMPLFAQIEASCEGGDAEHKIITFKHRQAR
jgi:hypothetical protein